MSAEEAVCVIVATSGPSTIASLTAVTVTVCGIDQFPELNGTNAESDTSGPPARFTVTVADGADDKATVYESVAPPSVTETDAFDTDTAAESLSVIFAVTGDAGVIPRYSAADPA